MHETRCQINDWELDGQLDEILANPAFAAGTDNGDTSTDIKRRMREFVASRTAKRLKFSADTLASAGGGGARG